MKFWKILSALIVATLPDWRDKFLSYKDLERQLKLIYPNQDDIDGGRPCKRLRLIDDETGQRYNDYDCGNCEVTKEVTDFVRLLVQEICKFNAFFVDQEEDYIIGLKAAEILKEDGIEAEVINLRSIRPLDRSSIVNSGKKTKRLVTVEERFPQHGVGAKICALVVEEILTYMDAPVERIAGADVPMHYASHLERLALPQIEDVIRAARRACHRNPLLTIKTNSYHFCKLSLVKKPTHGQRNNEGLENYQDARSRETALQESQRESSGTLEDNGQVNGPKYVAISGEQSSVVSSWL